MLGLVDVCRSVLTDGGAHVAASTVPDVDDAAHWFPSRDRSDELGLLHRLLTSPAPAAVLPDLALTSGGADGCELAGSAADAERLGSAACAGLIGDRCEDVRVDRSHASWSGWFGAVVRDGTRVLTDAREARVTLL